MIDLLTLIPSDEEILKDLEMKEDDLVFFSFRIPKLFVKYQSVYDVLSLEKNKTLRDLEVMYKYKFIFYTTEYPQKINKTDVPMFISADDDYSVLKLHLSNLEHYMDKIQQTLKHISSLSLHVKNTISLLNFKHGKF